MSTYRRLQTLVIPAALALVAIGLPARAEVIELLDATKVSGTIVHYYDGVFSVETGGNVVKIPRDKVRRVQFDLPPPRKELSTPRKTFERWQGALEKGDLETVIDCYALMYQGLLASQVGAGGQDDGLKKMREELKGTRFTIKASTTDPKGVNATLKVLREKDDASDTGEIAFVKENGEWKMLPPQ